MPYNVFTAEADSRSKLGDVMTKRPRIKIIYSSHTPQSFTTCPVTSLYSNCWHDWRSHYDLRLS